MSINDSQRGWRDANYQLAEKRAMQKEIDRLTADNKGLITCLKKDVTYKQAVELAKRDHEMTKLTSENKELTEALKKECDDRDEMYDKADELGEEVAVWIGAYEEATKWKAHYSDRAIAWVQKCRQLTADNKLMREALEHYSMKERYFYIHGCLSDIAVDSGAKARDALTAIKGEPI